MSESAGCLTFSGTLADSISRFHWPVVRVGRTVAVSALHQVRIRLSCGGVTAALLYESGLPAMLVALRTAAAIAVVVKLLEVMRMRTLAGTAGRSWTPKENYGRKRLFSAAWPISYTERGRVLLLSCVPSSRSESSGCRCWVPAQRADQGARLRDAPSHRVITICYH